MLPGLVPVERVSLFNREISHHLVHPEQYLSFGSKGKIAKPSDFMPQGSKLPLERLKVQASPLIFNELICNMAHLKKG